jgi:hypothetical protein
MVEPLRIRIILYADKPHHLFKPQMDNRLIVRACLFGEVARNSIN